MRNWSRAGRRPADTSGAAGVGASSWPAQVGSAEVVLFTRVGCHLCEQAEPVVAGICTARPASLAVIDVDSDEALRERFTAHVPVLFVGGRLLDYWQVDAERLTRALDGVEVSAPAML